MSNNTRTALIQSINDLIDCLDQPTNQPTNQPTKSNQIKSNQIKSNQIKSNQNERS